ncbi:glycoside hydrolase family 15 protein [Melittangium boletus]|uniref:GH15-like domain-containing protein n=1 Tax=Melittangium boletus DSM 14713 TaxID=1294270 RepID=A0A250IFV0_9BACT|nr:glycoside hydrolase family 15 protein [Melittangium boletus]ATB29806.1 hypothetical protein MEBOL_003261 [Melittangium boletus DSM 14713]
MDLHATFDFARAQARVEPHGRLALLSGAGQSLALRAPVRLVPGEGGRVSARWRIHGGQRGWVVLTSGGARPEEPPTDAEAERALALTRAHWERWANQGDYCWLHTPLLRRGALTLKLLTHAPTGTLVAAPTTSLPEVPGGVRNWDYRYTWLRDSAWVMDVFMGLGHREEARAFLGWLESLGLEHRAPSVLYRVDGGRVAPEHHLTHLAGHGGARPVTVGNDATHQVQLDLYGEVMGAASLFFSVPEHCPPEPGVWGMLRALANEAARRWREPDRGPWEEPPPRRHYLASKLMCWVAVDRALRLAVSHQLEGPLAAWARARHTLRRALETQGYDARRGTFTHALGESELDASVLLVPLTGFLPASDPRVRASVARVCERLCSGALVHRYLHPDGLPGQEGAFLQCGFWLVDVLAMDGRLEEAHARFERLVAYANDVGLFSEEVEPSTGALLGNHPQALAHLSMLRAARTLTWAEERLRRGSPLDVAPPTAS